MPGDRLTPLVSPGIAVAAVIAATVLRWALDPIVGDHVPYATYYAVVVCVALVCDLRAATLTVVASAFLGSYLFVEPRGTFALHTAHGAVGLFLFVATGLLVLLLALRRNRIGARLAAAAQAEAEHAATILKERARKEAIIASIPGVVWEAWGEPDPAKHRINYVSSYVRNMLGYTEDEWTSQPNFWLKIVAPDDREAAARVAAETFSSGSPGENEFRWIAKHGRVIWVIARSAVIKDENGAPIGVRGVAFEITARKEVEQRLALLAEISTSGLSAPVFKDLATHVARRVAEVVGDYCIIRTVNGESVRAVASAHVSPEAEPVVRAISEFANVAELSPLYKEMFRNPRALVDNDVKEDAFAQIDRTGFETLFDRYRARRGILAPMICQGRLLGIIGIGRAGQPYADADVRVAEAIASRAALALDNARLFESAQREADLAREARTQAEEAGRVKDEFLATLSHELRTPLNAILGWAHMLRDPKLAEDRRQAAVETILRNAQSQEQLISDILDVQRIMAGKIRLNLRIVDLSSIVRAAAETVQPSAEAKAIRLQLQTDLDVPPIRGDSDRLQQVVWNLLSNAIKFAPRGGRVQVRLSAMDSWCELAVEDNGPGINPDFIPFMFDRFRQADSSTTRTHKGLGLGLAITRSLVEMHGGTIDARNVSDGRSTGALFTLRLPRQPLKAASDAADDGDGAVAVWLGEAPSLEGIRVLVVDDESDARELLVAILNRCGADVSAAASADEGYELLSASLPDVLVSDIEMPHQDGYSFIRRVRALDAGRGGSVPAAALTAYASTGDRLRVLGAGFNMHIAKPVQPAELAMVVASLAGRRTAPQGS